MNQSTILCKSHDYRHELKRAPHKDDQGQYNESMRFYPGLCLRKDRILSIALLFAITFPLTAQDLADSKQLFRKGKLSKALEAASEALKANNADEDWWLLKCRCELDTGNYADANETFEAGLKAYPRSIRMREIGVEVNRFNGNDGRANELHAELGEMWKRSAWRYQDLADLLTVGRFLIADGLDAKSVLDQLYKKALERYPRQPEIEIAIGELALSKNDYQLAATHFRNAIAIDANDPRSHFGLAKAFRPNNSEVSNKSIDRVFELNPNHVGARLILIEQQIAGESYDAAEKSIEKVLAVNPKQPEAWAYWAVLAHLDSKYEDEGRFRTKALANWKSNPSVDHLIGLQLSRKYRFTESVAYQRRALVLDESYIPAKIQLAHDLLRLGQELEGWQLAEEVFDADQYNVVANNLVALRDNLGKFATVESEGFVVRMARNEADIYGDQVLSLLIDAEKKLASKYQVKIQKPVFVEIFPRQQDFAIRTFSLPGGAGFLGVCFGRVITMNSPAAQGATLTNWKSVLWHEFCHVVTLQKTRNRMPRWLSEGISVYEEQLVDSGWSTRMSPTYREMILGEDLTPVSELSQAFLKARTPQHLQFAYFESSLVVKFLVENFGQDSVVNILDSLGKELTINDAISRHAGPIDLLDRKFETYIKKQANEFGKNFSWEQPESAFTDSNAWEKWLSKHENSFFGLLGLAAAQIKESEPDAALKTLESFEELFTSQEGEVAVEMLRSQAYRQLKQIDNETSALEAVLKLDASEIDACIRLLQIYMDSDDYPNVKRTARLLQSINPLLKSSHRALAKVAEQQNDDVLAIESLAALATMDPLDRADTHYRLASAQFRQKQFPKAKRNVLLALEVAPRFRDAHRLLLKIVKQSSSNSEEQSPAAPGPLTPDAPKLELDPLKKGENQQ